MNFLVPVNGSKASLAAVRHAATAARKPGDRITLVNVQPRLPSHVARFTSRSSREAMRAGRSEAALATARSLLDSAGADYSVMAVAGYVPEAVVDAARLSCADQIVLGATRRAGWWQALFSRVPRIMDLADIPVAVVGAGRSGKFERYGIPACVGLGLTVLVIASE